MIWLSSVYSFFFFSNIEALNEGQDDVNWNQIAEHKDDYHHASLEENWFINLKRMQTLQGLIVFVSLFCFFVGGFLFTVVFLVFSLLGVFWFSFSFLFFFSFLLLFYLLLLTSSFIPHLWTQQTGGKAASDVSHDSFFFGSHCSSSPCSLAAKFFSLFSCSIGFVVVILIVLILCCNPRERFMLKIVVPVPVAKRE